MDYKHMTAPCGLACFICPIYTEKSGFKTFFISSVVRLIMFKRIDLNWKNSHCQGCRAEDGKCKAVGFKEPCHIYSCAQEKGVDFCFECDDFPCDYLHPYRNKAMLFPHNTKVFNLLQIKKLGLEQWAKTKAKSISETYYKGKLRLS